MTDHSSMSKYELLEEMVKFQERVAANNGKLTLPLIKEGISLYTELFEQANTPELRNLSQSYLKHLRYEKSLLVESNDNVIKVQFGRSL